MSIAVIASGESAKLLSGESRHFDHVIWSNPMRFPNPSVMRFIVRSVNNGARLWTVNNTNGVEPVIPLRLVFRPEKSIQIRYEAHSNRHNNGQDCGLVRDMTRVGKMAEQHNPTPLDSFLSCAEAAILRSSTGFIAARIAAELSDEVHLFGFDFYQGRPADFLYHLHLFPHVTSDKKLRELSVRKGLLKLFSEELIQKCQQTTFYLHRPKEGQNRYTKDPSPEANLIYI